VQEAYTPYQIAEWVAYFAIEPFGHPIPADTIIPETQTPEQIEADLFGVFF
jgi:hypothetical protein